MFIKIVCAEMTSPSVLNTCRRGTAGTVYDVCSIDICSHGRKVPVWKVKECCVEFFLWFTLFTLDSFMKGIKITELFNTSCWFSVMLNKSVWTNGQFWLTPPPPPPTLIWLGLTVLYKNWIKGIIFWIDWFKVNNASLNKFLKFIK